jgi:hypothetical protein
LTLIDGALGISGSGTGDVVGPDSSTAHGIAFYADDTGLLLENTPFDPSNNSLLGYGETGLPVNITAGANVLITGNVISVASGAGNVTGSGTPTALTFPVYADTTGLAIQPSDVALTASSLVGVDDGGAGLINVTAGSGITISGGIIAATAGGGGNVVGSGTSVTHTLPMYTDTTGLAIEPSPISLTANTILGTNAGGTALTNVSAGTGISIVAGVISNTGSAGDVMGPESSTTGAIAAYTSTDGNAIGNVAYIPMANSLVGYGPDGGYKVANIRAGTNITITDDGFINASGGGGGGDGDVTGPSSSIDGNFALFSGTTGKFIENTAYTPAVSSLVGYDSNSKPFNYGVGTGLALVNNNLISNGQIPTTISGPVTGSYSILGPDLGKTIWAIPTGPVTYFLPKATSVPSGFQCWVAGNFGSSAASIIFEAANIVTDTVYSNIGSSPAFGSLEINTPRWAKITLIDQASGSWYVEIDASTLVRSRTITEAGFTPNGLDNGGIVALNNNANAFAVTLPPSTNLGYPIGYTFTLYQIGSQTTPITAAGSDTITSALAALNVTSITTEGLGTSITFTLTGSRGSAVWLTQYSSVIYASPKVVTGSYTATRLDGNATIYMDSSGTFTLPAAVQAPNPPLPPGWKVKVIQGTSGAINIIANTLTSDKINFYPGGIQTPITGAGTGAAYDIELVGIVGSVSVFSITGPST